MKHPRKNTKTTKTTKTTTNTRKHKNQLIYNQININTNKINYLHGHHLNTKIQLPYDYVSHFGSISSYSDLVCTISDRNNHDVSHNFGYVRTVKLGHVLDVVVASEQVTLYGHR